MTYALLLIHLTAELSEKPAKRHCPLVRNASTALRMFAAASGRLERGGVFERALARCGGIRRRDRDGSLR